MERSSCRAALIVVVGLAAVVAPSSARALIGNDQQSGAVLYRGECAPCHGAEGRGDGAQARFFAPPPRDLQRGFLLRYKPDALVHRMQRSRLLVISIDTGQPPLGEADVEQLVAHLKRLADVDWRRVARGETLYAARCEPCHGSFGSAPPGTPLPPGARRAPRDLGSAAFRDSVDDAELARLARHAGDGMPAIPALREPDDAAALVAYLRLLSPGFAAYSLWCAGCHADDGRGEGILATAVDDPKVSFDRAYLAAHDDAKLRHDVLHLFRDDEPGLPHFARELSDAQASAVLDYVRAAAEPESTAPATPAPVAAGPDSPSRR